jgi:hypothetical protein
LQPILALTAVTVGVHIARISKDLANILLFSCYNLPYASLKLDTAIVVFNGAFGNGILKFGRDKPLYNM